MKNIQAKLQTFAGAMMVPVILLVIVGFFVGIGSAFANYIIPSGNIVHSLFVMVQDLGFMIMNTLPIWFAVGIAFTLAKKEKGWAAFSGLFMFFALIKGIQSYAALQGYNAETTSVDYLMSNGMTEIAALNFNSLWSTTMGIFTYNMGIFSGLVAGLVASLIHNKWVDTELPNAFGFFAGPKFVVIMVALLSIPLALVFYYIWPIIASGLTALTSFIGSSGLFGTWVFGTVDKMLLPFGIHHLIAFPIEYSAVGGTMTIDGVLYEGVRNIINGQAASANATGYITRNFTTGRVLFQLAGLPGAAFAMYKTAHKENRKQVASLLIPAVLTLALVGISEPIEYTFLFVAPGLYYLLYAPLSGLMYVLTEITQVSINGNALLFMVPNLFQPHKVHAMSLLYLLPLAFALYYFTFKFAIEKFNLKTPGRDGEIKLWSKKEYREAKDMETASSLNDVTTDSLENRIIEALGGPENIDSVSACATRLRVTVKDDALVATDDQWREHLNAMGVVRGNKSYQIIYGVQVSNILTRIKDILGRD